MTDEDNLDPELTAAIEQATDANRQAEQALESCDSQSHEAGPVTAAPDSSPSKSDELLRMMVVEAMEDQKGEWEAKLDTVKAEAADYKDKFLRLAAEFENHKKRSAREVENKIQKELERLLADFLPMGDNLARAKHSAQGSQEILEGISIIEHSFFSALAKHDIAPVLSLGCEFDSQIHDALSQREDESPKGTIVEEFEKGYLWRGRLLKAARVIVSAGPAKEE